MPELTIAPASYEAAKFAVTHWHYSRVLPTGKLVKIGVWEDRDFIGVVIFSRGACPTLGSFVGLEQTQCCELTRVALTLHESPVSQIVSHSLKRLNSTNPGLRLVVSFADPRQGHHGGIYQAGNWVYTGTTEQATEYLIDGKWRHAKSAYELGRQRCVPTRKTPGKYRYLYPLDKSMRRRVNTLRLQYPHAVEDSMVSRSSSTAEGQVRPLPTAPSETNVS